MVARTEAVPVVTKWHWMPQDLFGDLRLRYGIKMGLAGLLALFCTQVLRLPHDNWAILTVLVLMSAQFVGSITVKAIMRVIGTIAGALVGIWLVGDYTSTPAIFLPGPFPGHGSCQLQVRPSRCTPGPICLFFARSHHAYRRYRWGHGSGTSMADRPRPIGGDFGRNHELASGNKRALAPLRAGRVCSKQGVLH